MATHGDFLIAFWDSLKDKSLEERIAGYIDHMSPGETISASMLVCSAIHCDPLLHPTPEEEFETGMQVLCRVLRKLKKAGQQIRGPSSPKQIDAMITKLCD